MKNHNKLIFSGLSAAAVGATAVAASKYHALRKIDNDTRTQSAAKLHKEANDEGRAGDEAFYAKHKSFNEPLEVGYGYSDTPHVSQDISAAAGRNEGDNHLARIRDHVAEMQAQASEQQAA